MDILAMMVYLKRLHCAANRDSLPMASGARDFLPNCKAIGYTGGEFERWEKVFLHLRAAPILMGLKRLPSTSRLKRQISPEFAIIPLFRHIGDPCEPNDETVGVVKMEQKTGDRRAAYTYFYAGNNKIEGCDKLNVEDCIKKDICGYVCTATLPQPRAFKAAKLAACGGKCGARAVFSVQGGENR